MRRRHWLALAVAGAMQVTAPIPAMGEELWSVRGGSTTIDLSQQALDQLKLNIDTRDDSKSAAAAPAVSLDIDDGSALTFMVGVDIDNPFLGGEISHIGRLIIRTSTAKYVLTNPTLRQTLGPSFAVSWDLTGEHGEPGLTLGRTRAGFNPASEALTIHSPDLAISPGLADALGDPSLADQVIGTITIRASSVWTGGDKPVSMPPSEQPAGGERAIGPDMKFCQLYGLGQWGRLGDIVGLAVATTSWNIGNRDMLWFQTPDTRHPFIMQNLYRLKNDRFEQIGMASIKHGFYALGNVQCGGTCTYESGHSQGNWLGQGCTDTYSASLNASQSGMSPRSEVNGWTGAWTYVGSHMYYGHSHNTIAHRLQVRDADLNPPQNVGATYYCEGYYHTLDDINPINSASWKPVTVSGGSPGGTWTFGMSGSSTRPTDGFAIDAWTGATQTVLAQQVPPVRFVSPDGECVLAAKATALGGGVWHYEYALLNVNMHRKVNSFTIPIAPWFAVTNIGFSAVLIHDEPYSNTAWSPTVTNCQITWSTTDNPLQWNTLYNFRFDAAASPVSTATVTLGLYEPGTPTVVTGTTVGPNTAVAGDALRGGLLWDKWWMVNDAAEPTGNHPLYPPAGQQSGSITYRCKECHGWDYKGFAGAYGSGPHYTGIRGVYGSTMNACDTFQIIKSATPPNGHGFSSYGLSDQDILDLVQFLQTLMIDTDTYINPVGGAFNGDTLLGHDYYDNGGFISCMSCHGEDGATINFGTPENPEWVGTRAVNNPWELLQKIRFGQPGMAPMGSWLAWGGTNQGAADIGAYAQQSLAVDCLDNSYCAQGDPCNRILMCSPNGRCVHSTLDGDVNSDSFANGTDIQMFVDAVVAGSTDPAMLGHADFSDNAVMDPDDIPCMVTTLLTP